MRIGEEEGRRAFLRTLSRYALLGGFTWTAWALASRQRSGPVPACDRDGRCRGCAALVACGLPPARGFRRGGGW